MHVLAATSTDFAATALESDGVSPALALFPFAADGTRLSTVPFSAGSTLAPAPDPVLVPLLDDGYVAVWTDSGGDGDGLGVVLRAVDPRGAALGTIARANTTTTGDQYGADAVWTNEGLVVAWADDSRDPASADLRAAVFDVSLQATGPELSLASTSDTEADVALAPFETTWAAAWRAFGPAGETIHARTALGSEWTIGPFPPAPADARPAILELDATHLLVAFAAPATSPGDAGALDTGVVPTLVRAAVLDTSVPGAASLLDLAPGATVAQGWPSLARAGGRLFASWWTSAVAGDPNGEDVWLAELSWTAAAGLSVGSVVPLPRSHRLGDQRRPALAAMGGTSNASLLAGWDDLAPSLAGESDGDVLLEVIPIPMLRVADDAGP